MEDMLSQLPDDVLVSILSKLTLKEAVLASCLSSRWRYIWTHVTRLNFDLPRQELEGYYTEFGREESLRHINLVNHVLGLHKSSLLEEFIVASPFYTSFQCEVDKWLKFALSTKVQSLKIKLIPQEWRQFVPINACLDLKRFLDLSSSPIFGFKYLKVLTLDGLDVDSQVVKIFLSSCPLLEQLSIRESTQLQHLEVGPSFKLKHLEIFDCEIDYLEICNVNLVSFSFTRNSGNKTKLLLENVSSVVHLHIAVYLESLHRLIDLITPKFTQLVKLSLEVDPPQFEGLGYYHSFPKFNNLKWLIVFFKDALDSTILEVTPLLQASPYLQTFEIKIRWTNTRIFQGSIPQLFRQNTYQHLKVVRYVGYLGSTADKELITYLVKKSLALEKVIVIPCDHSSYSRKKSFKVERRSRSRAWRQLQGIVPKEVELMIL
ncbi:F-box/FBD/LRR-repeat protein At1g13570-like [Lycium barbarum]|uniref:F-box/FBD/LRR-repeat protein At1g13570-like n=1 Tax=Lycium barbarum TaxID=112863 RepID=UPI00293F6132|nr:F-box/FBD/LRR-repeat protein At1g13570-like [Lycium barbarum]